MPTTTHRVRMTYDDLLALPEDGLRHELIDGEHIATPSPRLRHQVVSGRLYLIIGTWLQEHPIGDLFYAPVDVILTQYDVVEPDLLYLSHARQAEVVADGRVRGMPELLIEILSPSTHRLDKTRKRELYERHGVHEYWIVDPDAGTVVLHRRVGATFTSPLSLSSAAQDVLNTPMFPGLEIPLTPIFAA